MVTPQPVEVITADSVTALALGLELLGSGSAGNPRPFVDALRAWLKRRDLPIFAWDAFPTGTVVPVGMVGSTSVVAEKLPNGREFQAAVRAVSRWAESEPEALMATEAGGLNGLLALLASLEVGLPFLDVDLMGRAMPGLDQFTWAVRGLPLTPAAICSPDGHLVVVDGVDDVGLERTVRALVSAAGGWVAMALRPTASAGASEHAVIGSMARALRLGRELISLPDRAEPPGVAERLGGAVVAEGRVIEVERYRAQYGFGRGSALIEDRSTGTVIRLEMENELLLVLADGVPIASCPDILCLLGRRTWAPISVDNVRTGQEVVLMVLPAPRWWLQADVLPAVGPRAFDLDCDPILMEARL